MFKLLAISTVFVSGSPGHVNVSHYDKIVLGCGAAGAFAADLLIADGQTVGVLDAKLQCGGAVNTVDGQDFGVKAYLNTSAYVPLGFNFTFDMLGWAVDLVGEENITRFPALGYQGPYITADPNLGGALKFTFNSGNLTEADILWLYDNLTTAYPELSFQAGFPADLDDSLRQNITSWVFSDPVYEKFGPMLEDACRGGGFDPDLVAFAYLVKDLVGFLLAYIRDGLLFAIKPGNQFLYDRMAQRIRDSAGSGLFLGASVSSVNLNGGSGPVSVQFTAADGSHHVMHGNDIVWAIPATPDFFSAVGVRNLPTAVSTACSNMTTHAGLYSLMLAEVSNPFGIPVVSVTNESAPLKQPAERGVVFLYNQTAGVWGGMAVTNNASDDAATVTQAAHSNLSAIQNMTIPGYGFVCDLDLQIQQAWKHESYFVHFPIEKLQRHSYQVLEEALCSGNMAIIGNGPGHSDTPLLNQKTIQTFAKCGFTGEARRRKLKARRELRGRRQERELQEVMRWVAQIPPYMRAEL